MDEDTTLNMYQGRKLINYTEGQDTPSVMDTRDLLVEQLRLDVKLRWQVAELILIQYPLHKQLQGALLQDPGKSDLASLAGKLAIFKARIYNTKSLDDLDALTFTFT